MIPAPPFADAVEARQFLKLLSLHLAALDRDRVTLQTFILLTVLNGIHQSMHRLPNDDSPVHLPASILHIALLSRFPIPWTPQSLHSALDAGDDWSRATPSTATVFEKGHDPRITATRSAEGTWNITQWERGTTYVNHSGLSDDEYVQVLLDEERGHPFPYGWKWEDVPGADEVLRASQAARERWDSGAGRLPYLTNWIDGRDDLPAGRDPQS
jgi:hypothetical protein